MSSSAQNIMGFIDYQQKFQVFEDGIFRQADYKPIQSFKVGHNAIGYVDQTPEFKIYYNGQTTDIDYAADIDYQATRNLIVYRINKVLKVFDRGEIMPLTYFLGTYVAGDSIVGFYDDYSHVFKAYYKGKVMEVETNLFSPPKKILAGSNALMYLDPNDYLKIFYRGRVTNLGTNLPQQFAVGRNIAAWVDEATQSFRVFYYGDTASLEVFPPTSFKCGDDLVAYVDNSGAFKILLNGTLTTVRNFAPDFFEVKDCLVLYEYNNIFSVFYDGHPVEIECYMILDYQVSNNGFAYLDDMGRLKFFHNGKVETISVERPVKYILSGNVLWYKLGVNENKIFYNGREY